MNDSRERNIQLTIIMYATTAPGDPKKVVAVNRNVVIVWRSFMQ